MANEAEDTMRSISLHKGIVGVILVDDEGIPIKYTIDNALAVQYAGLTRQLIDKGRTVVKDLDPTDELKCLRIRTTKYEIIVAPDKDFLFIIVQNPVVKPVPVV